MSRLVQEALRYMGATEEDSQSVALVIDCFIELGTVAVPRHCITILPQGEVRAMFDSQSLAAYLDGHDEAALLAATLGIRLEQRLRRIEATDTLRAAAMHACASARIEAYCDEVQTTIPGANGPRFSPGYGDFPLQAQHALLSRLDATRQIGLYLTEGGMLVPSKSVTAVIALGLWDGASCGEDKCARCDRRDCAYRREGGQ